MQAAEVACWLSDVYLFRYYFVNVGLCDGVHENPCHTSGVLECSGHPVQVISTYVVEVKASQLDVDLLGIWFPGRWISFY